MTFRMTREFYIPKGFDLTRHDEVNALVYTSSTPKPAACGFSGKRAKYDFYYSFRTIEQRDAHVARWLDGLQSTRDSKVARNKQRTEFRHTLKIGDVLMSSWGYEQTNIDFYEVTALAGEHFVYLRPLKQQREEDLYMQGDCVPVPGRYNGDAKRHRVQEGNSIRIASYAYASPYKMTELRPGVKIGKPVRFSSYA